MNAWAVQKSTASATHGSRKREDIVEEKKLGKEKLRPVSLILFLFLSFSFTSCFENFEVSIDENWSKRIRFVSLVKKKEQEMARKES